MLAAGDAAPLIRRFTMKFTVSLPTDADGFISRQCPACNRRFKVRFGDGSMHPAGYCPYCAHADGSWLTDDQREYCKSAVNERVVRPMLDDFTRNISRMNRPGSLVRVSASVKHASPVLEPVESDQPMAIATFPCCGERIKHDGSTMKLHCIICGKVADSE